MTMTEEQLKAYWAETLSIVRFQERLKAETEDGKYRILAEPLRTGFEQFKPNPS